MQSYLPTRLCPARCGSSPRSDLPLETAPHCTGDLARSRAHEHRPSEAGMSPYGADEKPHPDTRSS